jgi:hypothetical protein
MSSSTYATYSGLRMSFQGGVGSIIEEYVVPNIDYTAFGDPADIFTYALGALGIAYTFPHPTVAGLYANTIDGRLTIPDRESASRGNATITVGWSTPSFVPIGGVKVELSGSNSQIVLNRWPNGPQKGQPILVAYDRNHQSGEVIPTQISPADVITAKALGVKFDSVEILLEAPNAILSLSRTLFAFPQADFLMRGHLNSKKWLGFDPFTVLFRNMVAENMVGAGTIIPTYWNQRSVFEIAPDPTYWQRVEFFRDEHTGKLIVGTDIFDGSNNGYVIVDPYGDAVDFNAMKYPANLLK